MPHQPHPDLKAVTYRIHKDLVGRVKTAAETRGETEVAFVKRALEAELDRCAHAAAGSSTPSP